MHSLIMGLVEPKMEIDHKDKDGLNNRKSNLRICSYKENSRNKDMQRNNTSGYKGVRFYSKLNKFSAQIKHSNDSIHLGYFTSAKVAAIAYDIAALKYHGEFARTNFLHKQKERK
jgi:hypothetical protein